MTIRERDEHFDKDSDMARADRRDLLRALDGLVEAVEETVPAAGYEHVGWGLAGDPFAAVHAALSHAKEITG